MRRANPVPTIRSCSGALLAFLAWVVVGPGSAVAGCSSHDLSAGVSVTSLETLDRAGDLAAEEVDRLPGRPKPCFGPSCSGRPAIPPAPLTPKITRTTSWAILPIVVEIESTGRDDSRLVEASVRPIHAPGSIFHPPRPAASLPTS